MFPKSKYSKSNQSSSNYKSNLNISIKPVKYHPNIYSKKKTTLNKKMSFQSNNNKFTQNHTWKKHNSHNNWNKENNKNYLNYEQYNTNYDSNQYYYIPKEKRENKANYNKDKDKDKEYSPIYSYESNDYISYGNQTFKKNEKNNSIEYTTTQSNSSTHEESNNNQYNSNENAYPTVTNENFVSNDSQTLNMEDEEETTKQSSSNNINGIIDFKSLNSNLENAQETENDSNDPNTNNQKEREPILVQTHQKKNKKQKKYKKNYTFSKELDINKSNSGNVENEFQLNEPYNKFNSVNSELNEPIIVPMVENTEILKVNVKISKDKYVVFKLRRFDDLFLTVKLFCEINSIEEKLIRPLITKALCTLNSIYQIYNTQLDPRNIKILQMLKTINSDSEI